MPKKFHSLFTCRMPDDRKGMEIDEEAELEARQTQIGQQLGGALPSKSCPVPSVPQSPLLRR